MTTELNLSPIFSGYGGVADGPGYVGGGAHTLAMWKVAREVARNIDDREGEEKRRGWAKEIADMLADVSEFREKVSPEFFWQECGGHNKFYSQLREANGWAQNSANHPMNRPAFLKWADKTMPELRRKWNKFQADKEGMLDAKKRQQRQQWMSVGGTVCNLAIGGISIVLSWSVLVGN